MKQSTKLGALANDLCEALPGTEVDLKLYISDLGMYHFGELQDNQISERPRPLPFYGSVFAAALVAVENGYDSRVDFHREYVAKEVRKAGGVLSPVKRMGRPIATMPQPTPRFEYDNGYVPRDGKE